MAYQSPRQPSLLHSFNSLQRASPLVLDRSRPDEHPSLSMPRRRPIQQASSLIPRHSLLDDEDDSIAFTPTLQSQRTPMSSAIRGYGVGLNEERQRQSGEGELCVTVFGFQRDHASLVLRHMQSHGQLIQHHAGDGNWLHLQFESRYQAQRALGDNGCVLDVGSGVKIMLGVCECTEPDIFGGSEAGGRTTRRQVMYQVSDRYGARIAALTVLRRRPVVGKNRSLLRHAPKKRTSICAKLFSWVVDWF